tara:strand:+ start:192 stop:458 length:267 start_codon:yes stop_codon:yes gene_type:complete
MTDRDIGAEQRNEWKKLLNAVWMFHRQLVKETAEEILGKESSQEHIFHQAASVAIQDCIHLIDEMEAYGYFDEGNDDEEPLSTPGLAG